ncbi:MAG: ATP-dependent zinc metalloprotease FtsH [Pseudomonadales bacterium]|nr:ATP-dependent zinc metalloprotease FtsH [Pseudomonadales bacterium]
MKNSNLKNSDNKNASGRGEGPQDPVGAPPVRIHYFLWVLIVTALVYSLMVEERSTFSEVPYSLFKQQVREGNVRTVTIKGGNVSGEFRIGVNQEGADEAVVNFKTRLLEIDDIDLLRDMEEHGVELKSQSDEDPVFLRLVIAIIPWLLIFGLFFYSRRMLQGGLPGKMGGFGKTNVERYEQGKEMTNFDDVAGLDQAKSELKEIIDYLKEPDRYLKMGARIPRGVLLMGPPGTGKTLLAKATAGEAGVPFFNVSGSEFVEMFVGVGASRVRDLFKKARAETPSLIFIDEIDSIGRARSSGMAVANDERDQTLNQILAEMDGFDSNETVVVLAATNRPDILDPALLRPGRFDRKVTLELPHQKARFEIFNVHIKDHPLSTDIDIEELSRRTVGFSGAEIANLVNEAALNAARNNKQEIDKEDFETARDRIVLGIEYGELLNPDEKRRIAYHEAGHTLTAFLSPDADPPKKVSIIPRGRALGVTEQEPAEDRHSYTEVYLHAQLRVLMGGRCAERLEYQNLSTGASDDLRRATQLARQMLTQWGMSERIGPVIIDNGAGSPYQGQTMGELSDISEHTLEVIDDEIKALLLGVEHEVYELLEKNQEMLDQLVVQLVDHETLGEAEIKAILSSPDKPSS